MSIPQSWRRHRMNASSRNREDRWIKKHRYRNSRAQHEGLLLHLEFSVASGSGRWLPVPAAASIPPLLPSPEPAAPRRQRRPCERRPATAAPTRQPHPWPHARRPAPKDLPRRRRRGPNGRWWCPAGRGWGGDRWPSRGHGNRRGWAPGRP